MAVPAIYNLVSQELNNPDGWKEHLQWLEDSFKSGIRAYGSCISITAGSDLQPEAGIGCSPDEDLISPHIMFAGMPTWDSVMAQPYQERMRAFRDTETRRALSAEAVEGTVAQASRRGWTAGVIRGGSSTGAGTSSRSSWPTRRGTGSSRARASSNWPKSRARGLWRPSWTCPWTRTLTPTSYASTAT